MRGRVRKSGLPELFAFLEYDRGRYLAFVLGDGILYSLGRVLQTFSTGQVVSLLESRREGAIFMVVALLLVSAAMSVTSRFCLKGAENCVNRMNERIRERVFRKIPGLSAAWFDTANSGELISRVTNDMGSFTPLFSDNIPGIFFFVAYGVISILAAMGVNWQLCVIFVICSLGFKGINDLVVARIRDISADAYEKNAGLVERLLLILTGVPVIRLFGMQEKMERDYRRENEEYTHLSVRLESWKGFQNAANALMTSTVADLAVILGAWLVLYHRVSLAELVVLSQLSGSVTMMFRWSEQILGEAGTAGVAGNRIRELLEEEEEPEGFADDQEEPEADGTEGQRKNACPEKVPKEAVRFEHVSFSYGEKPVLADVSFSVVQGETLALTGESGGGKSTVLKLLLGFYDVQKGRIYLNGSPLSAYTRREARKLFSYVSQDSFLFSDSVFENIRCGRPEAGIEEVKRAAKLAYADGFIEELPEGYDTSVGERAVRLSGGQRQRIAIARALLKDAPILLLDEATSALDAQSQLEVQMALERLMEGRTVIMIAHRLSTIRGADEVLVIEGGKVRERIRKE